MSITCYTIFSSPLGELLVAGHGAAVVHVRCDVDVFLAKYSHIQQAEAGSVVANAAQSIRAYLHAWTTDFALPLDVQGTVFQKKVWAELLKIPYGGTSSYTQIAQRIGKPKAFRAVANACGQNPVPIIIPCHRVVHKSGNVSGFAWGVEAKKILLSIEAQHISLALAA